MATTEVISITHKNATDFIPRIKSTSSGRRNINELIGFLSALVGGAKEASNITWSTTAKTSSATLTFTSVAAGSVISVNGVYFTAVSGTPVRANNEFQQGVTDTADAADFATAIGASTSAGIVSVVTATAAAGVVTLTSAQSGADTTAITVQTKGIMASGTVTLASVAANDTVTLNGVVLTAKTSAPGAHQWLVGVTDTADAAALAALINSDASVGLKGYFRATSAAAVVTVYSLLPGLPGNTLSLASSNGGRLAVSGALLTGGAVAQWKGVQATGTCTITSGSGTETATINGTACAVTWASSDNNTAILLRDKINSTSALNGIVYASAATNVVTITAVEPGPSGNAISLAASGTGNVASGTALASGAVPTQVVVGGSGVQEAQGNVYRLGGGGNDALISQGIQTI